MCPTNIRYPQRPQIPSPDLAQVHVATRGPDGAEERRLQSPADARTYGAQADPALSQAEQLRLQKLGPEAFVFSLPQVMVVLALALPPEPPPGWMSGVNINGIVTAPATGGACCVPRVPRGRRGGGAGRRRERGRWGRPKGLDGQGCADGDPRDGRHQRLGAVVPGGTGDRGAAGKQRKTVPRAYDPVGLPYVLVPRGQWRTVGGNRDTCL